MFYRVSNLCTVESVQFSYIYIIILSARCPLRKQCGSWYRFLIVAPSVTLLPTIIWFSHSNNERVFAVCRPEKTVKNRPRPRPIIGSANTLTLFVLYWKYYVVTRAPTNEGLCNNDSNFKAIVIENFLQKKF